MRNTILALLALLLAAACRHQPPQIDGAQSSQVEPVHAALSGLVDAVEADPELAAEAQATAATATATATAARSLRDVIRAAAAAAARAVSWAEILPLARRALGAYERLRALGYPLPTPPAVLVDLLTCGVSPT